MNVDYYGTPLLVEGYLNTVTVSKLKGIQLVRECTNCRGCGKFIIAQKPPSNFMVGAYNECNLSLKTELIDCPNCKGVGRIRPFVLDRVKLYYDNRLYGTVPSVYLRLADIMNPLVTLRPTDYWAETNDDGELIIIASDNLGPGDVQALFGFELS